MSLEVGCFGYEGVALPPETKARAIAVRRQANSVFLQSSFGSNFKQGPINIPLKLVGSASRRSSP